MTTNNQTNSPFPLAIAKGGTAVTSVTTSPTATAFAGWDANKNLSSNSFIAGYRTIATAGATTTLVVGDAYQQYFTGSTTQTVVLPVTSTLVLGQSYYIVNNSTGVVTVQSSGGNTIQAMASNTTLLVTCILTSGTTAASWNAQYVIESALTLPLAVTSGGTGLSSTTINQLLYSSSNNVIAGISVVNSAVLTTTAGGVPTWVAYIGTGSPVLATSPTLVTPTLGVASATSINFGGSALSTYSTGGTFTPVLKFGGGTTGITYNNQVGFYDRVGNVVFFAIFISLSSKGSSTGSATITGLPVAARNGGGFNDQMFVMEAGNITFTQSPYASLSSAGTTLNIFSDTSGAGVTVFADTNFANNSSFSISGSYLV